MLFKRTYLSFRLRCLDCDELIARWYAVDDGSSPEELATMKALAPHITWINKTSDQAGHVGSINTLLKVASQYSFFVWLEDDWFFMRDEYLITKALQVLRTNASIGQVLFNANYFDTDAESEKAITAGGDAQSVDGADYIVHRFCGAPGSPEHAACFSDARPGQMAHYHWPHFSLRPGLWNMANMAQVGSIQDGPNFEMQHGFKYVAAGLITAFLPNIHAVHLVPSSAYMVAHPHIAQEAYTKHSIQQAGVSQSAYDLLGTFR